MTQKERRIYLINRLLSEDEHYNGITIPESEAEQKRLLRSLINIRLPSPVGNDFLTIQDEYLQTAIAEKGITKLHDLTPFKDNIYLWQGDITTLECDAIVNAANSGMTGCYHPCHNCIDNCIHTFAGVRLRLKCAEIMRKQGYDEPTGKAKITPAYNLPCKYVIHTVGPIVHGRPEEKHCSLLKSCYESCLELAVINNIKSVAFCCISTGVFGFPQYRAAEIAVQTVREFSENHDIEVIFNVFKDTDYEIYRQLLR